MYMYVCTEIGTRLAPYRDLISSVGDQSIYPTWQNFTIIAYPNFSFSFNRFYNNKKQLFFVLHIFIGRVCNTFPLLLKYSYLINFSSKRYSDCHFSLSIVYTRLQLKSLSMVNSFHSILCMYSLL